MNNIINNKITNYNQLFILILQITALTNAVLLGWNIKEIKNNKFIISKKINNLTDLDNNTVLFLNTIMQLK